MNEHKIIQSRIPAVDLVEAIAMLMVVGYHCGCGLAVLSCCVPLFFMANGYLLLNKPFQLQTHIRKTLRLLGLILFWAFFKVLIYMPIKGITLSPKEVIETVTQLKTGWVNSLWFLLALLSVYVLFPLLKLCFDMDEKSFLWFTGVVGLLTAGWHTIFQVSLVVFSLLRHKYSALPVGELIERMNPISTYTGTAVLYFCLGGLLFRYQEQILAIPVRKRRIAAIGSIIVCCLCQELITAFYNTTKYIRWDGVFNGFDMVFAVVSTFCVFVLCLDYKTEKRWISMISRNSFGIYMLHETPIYLYQRFKPILVDVLPQNLLTLGAFLLMPTVSFGFALGITLLLRKNKFTSKLLM